MNRFPLLSKMALIGLLMLLLLVPLGMVNDLVQERIHHRQVATHDVARAHSGPQTLSGPVLHVPYTETYVRTVVTDGNNAQRRQETVNEARVLTVFPKTLETRSTLTTETRYRGIFPVTVYGSRHDTEGQFVMPELPPREPNGRITLGQPWLVLGVSDLRGLGGRPQLALNGQPLEVVALPPDVRLPTGLAAAVAPEALTPGAVLSVRVGLDLAGTGRIGFMPLAQDNTVTLTSTWPHPVFDGDFLPRSRRVSADGFEATWHVPALSTQAQQQFLEWSRSGRSTTGERPSPGASVEQFAVSLNDPVDVYRLSERATKYGLMFVLLTFAAFFVLETVKTWRIHPVQYLMVGAALVLFFLLLLSLSEHLGFLPAYGAASTASLLLLTHYLRHVLCGWTPALGMGGLLLALFGVLYGILIAEDNALVMGSLLMFGVLAAVMVATRRVDWATVMQRPAPTTPATPTNPGATDAPPAFLAPVKPAPGGRVGESGAESAGTAP